MLGRVAVAQRDVSRHRDPTIAEDGLEEVLVHAEGGGGDAGADVGDACELEQSLDGAVLAEGAVKDREHDVHASERGRRCSRVRDHREGLDRRVVSGGEALRSS